MRVIRFRDGIVPYYEGKSMANKSVAILREMALVRGAQIDDGQKEKLLAQMKVQLSKTIEEEEKLAAPRPAK